MAGKTCQICGKPSGMYPLCHDCFILRDKGEVLKCEECGTWHRKNEPCQCAKPEPKHTENASAESITPIFKDNRTPETTCLICNAEANGHLFCKECYYRYRHNTIYLQIENCETITLIGESEKYPEATVYTTKDGHKVRSKSEMAIDDYLFDHGILHSYEPTVSIDANPDHDIHPDFLLSGFNKDGEKIDIYIEHLGLRGAKKYDEKTEYKFQIYEKKGLTVIVTDENDMNSPTQSLSRKLQFFEKGKINFSSK